MAQNNVSGREPIQVVQIDQDFCPHTYGVPPCTASLSNFVANSSDFEDPDNWQINPGMSYSSGWADPDGGHDAIFVFVADGSTYLPDLYSEENIPQGISGPVWYSIYGKQTATGDIDSLTFQVKGASSVGGNIISVTLSFETISPVRFNGDDVEDYKVDRLEYGWVRWQFAVPRERVIQPGYYRFIYFSGESPASTGDSIYLYGPMITDRVDQPYIATTGEPINKVGDTPCFNTRATCQDPTNYEKDTLPLNFVTQASPGLTDGYYLPMLSANPKVTAAKLNPGGANSNTKALGTRAQLSVTFQDAPHNDYLVDPYRDQRDYNPLDRGTFWSKWRARNPYYMQRPIRLITGYLQDGALTDTITREFVITGFSGPTSGGKVTISAKDILTLAEDEKAQAPVASSGVLAADISDTATTLTLSPSGVGDSEYPSSGWVRVNKEVMAFTRSGDTLTVARGQYGTDASEHDADDTVQLCLRYSTEAPQDILEDLLVNYAGIPPRYINKAQWAAEALDYLPRKYSAIITEPTGVSTLVGEMCQQMYFTIWWDERVSEVKLRAVRLAQDDEITVLDDDQHIIAGSASWTDLTDQLITQVWVYYGQSNPTETLETGSNFATVSITADPSAEGEDKHNLRRVKTIYSRWIDATNASAAEDLGQRILNRYGNAPRQVTFQVDAKDSALWLGDYIQVTNRSRVNQYGLPVPVNLQIFEASESTLGSRYQFTAQEFIPSLTNGDAIEDPDTRYIPITSDLLNVNLRELHDSLFGAPTGSEKVTFVVREGVTIGGDAAGGGTNVPYAQRVTVNDFYDGGTLSVTGYAAGQLPILTRRGITSVTDTPKGATYGSLGDAAQLVREYPVSVALRTGSWPSGVELSLVVEAGGRIIGQGGNGSAQFTLDGVGGVSSFRKSVPGGDGGDALEVEYPITLTNGGVIAGGGGGGACYTFSGVDGSWKWVEMLGGGGGAGYEISDVRTYNRQATIYLIPVTRTASPGSTVSGGQGTLAKYVDNSFTRTQSAGSGGDLAASGGESYFLQTGAGAEGPITFGYGGEPGKAIASGASMIEWVNRGDVRGDEVS